MKILALEFSANERSVAVASAAGEILASLRESDFRGVTGMTLIDRALSQAKLTPADISLVAVGLGPGSYTGIRSAIAIAQGWQLGRDIKTVGISSVLCLVEEARHLGMRGTVSVIVDAQRAEVYCAKYEITSTEVRELQPLQIVAPSTLSTGDYVVGPEAAKFVAGARDLTPSAEILARLAVDANFVQGEELEPIYLRQTTFVKAPLSRHIP